LAKSITIKEALLFGGCAMLVNKREILQPMLDNIEPAWWIKKPSPLDPCDVEYMCIFQHTGDYREATVDIKTELFTDGKLVEIERLVRVAIANAKVPGERK
jgi:hypothetical protein